MFLFESDFIRPYDYYFIMFQKYVKRFAEKYSIYLVGKL
ncbi:hypothetical protein AMCSP13_002018 [Streptococcus pneumoniae 2070335]|nr:hypothetical protein AMCSP13_002018 [Streptococcus pneumoniae 2070335]